MEDLRGLSDNFRDVTREADCANNPLGEMVTLRPASLSPLIGDFMLDSISGDVNKTFEEGLFSV